VFRRLRWDRLPLVVITLQAIVLFIGIAYQTKAVRSVCLLIVASLGLWAWLRSLGVSRAIRDTPTSRIASAAQGYAELMGVAQPLPETSLVSPVTSLPCLWYRYRAQRRVGDKWVYEEAGQSDLDFVLDDGTGRCRICPQGAEVRSTHRETRQLGDLRYTEDVLLKGDRLYVLGDFVTDSGSHRDLDTRRDTGELLSEWKRDQDALRARFDLDGDRSISQEEWQLAQQAAHREVERNHRILRAQPARHFLREPANGMPFLIADMPQEGLDRIYSAWAWMHLSSLVAAFAGLVWISRLPP
jgi:hypothetical protein